MAKLISERDLKLLWTRVKRAVLDKKFTKVLLDALEAAQPITIDNDVLILGFKSGERHLCYHLEIADIRNLIETALTKELLKRATFRSIEGTTIADYEFIKAREQAPTEDIISRQIATKAEQAAELSAKERSWSALIEEIYTSYSQLSSRVLPQVRAEFVLEVFNKIKELKSASSTDAEKELDRKWVGRLLERLSNLVDISPVVLAILLSEREEANKK